MTRKAKLNIREELSITFSFQDLDILTVIEDDVYIRATLFDHVKEDSDPQECVGIMSRRVFNDTMNEWLDSKKRFFETYKHFCGVGYVGCYEFVEGEEINILALDQSEFDKQFDIDENAQLKYINVRSFRLLVTNIDMEHG